MGKRLISQRRGKGSPTYRAPRRGAMIIITYKNVEGNIVDIVDDPARNAPVAKVKYSDGSINYLIAPKGLKVGDKADFVLPVAKIPIGAQIFGIEIFPHSGPRMCNAPGSFAIVVSKAKDRAIIQLPSKKTKEIDATCRASMGVPAGDGFKEKPWMKAGKKWIAMHRRGKLYPRTSGVAMNAVDHPFGGPTKPGTPKTVSRHAPPGAKVGAWGARRTGRKRGKT